MLYLTRSLSILRINFKLCALAISDNEVKRAISYTWLCLIVSDVHSNSDIVCTNLILLKITKH